jgi:hypothetical protein
MQNEFTFAGKEKLDEKNLLQPGGYYSSLPQLELSCEAYAREP